MAKLPFGLIAFFCCMQLMYSQDTLCVYKAKGISILEKENKQVPLKKGAYILKNDIVRIQPKTEITAIDNRGSVYKINVEGTYALNHLLNFKIKQNSSGLTARYFKHIWDEMTNKEEKEVLIAGVFRGDLLMRFPKDSSMVASSKITLKWQLAEGQNLYYVFVKNKLTDDILKIETNGSQLALYNDNPIFNDTDSFEWTVTTVAFPNLDNIPFYHFKLIDRNTYEDLKQNYSAFIQDLKSVGTTDDEIKTILCETFGLCK